MMLLPNSFVKMEATHTGKIFQHNGVYKHNVKPVKEQRWFNMDKVISIEEDPIMVKNEKGFRIYKIALETPVGIDFYKVDEKDWPFKTEKEHRKELDKLFGLCYQVSNVDELLDRDKNTPHNEEVGTDMAEPNC